MALPARHTLYRVVALVCVIGIAAILASFPRHAFSATPTATLQGYAWSSNIGWICFYDTATPSNCGGATVNVNSDNSLSGYAWSNNVGWISFNASDTASCGSAATYNPSTGALSGWARALDGIDSDGCISLSCSNSGGCSTANYGVVFPGNTTTDFAWGSDVLGWISFWGSNYGVTDICADGLNYASYGPSCTCPSGQTQNGSACVANMSSITIDSFTTKPTSVQKNTPESVTFEYQVANPPAGGCTITGTGGFTTISLSQAQALSGSYTTTETVSQNTLLTLTCGSTTATATLGLVPTYQEI
jgi:hypothetical protein